MNTSDELTQLLDKFFVMRAGTPDDDLEALKLRNQSGEPSLELKQALLQWREKAVREARIDELEMGIYRLIICDNHHSQSYQDGWNSNTKQQEFSLKNRLKALNQASLNKEGDSDG